MGFHALRYNAEIEPASKGNDKSENSLVRRLGSFILNKLHIKLQDVEFHLVKHIKRRVAASEVVHFNYEAGITYALYRRNNLIRIFCIGAFRKLQVEP